MRPECSYRLHSVTGGLNRQEQGRHYYMPQQCSESQRCVRPGAWLQPRRVTTGGYSAAGLRSQTFVYLAPSVEVTPPSMMRWQGCSINSGSMRFIKTSSEYFPAFTAGTLNLIVVADCWVRLTLILSVWSAM